MSKINEHQEYLIIAKLTGSLTHEEERQFKELFDKNVDIQHAYEELRSRLPEPDVETSFARLREYGEWKDIGRDLRKQRTKRRVYRVGVALSILAVFAILGWLYFPKHQKDNIAAKTTIKSDKGVTLTLADGEVVDVSSIRGTYDAGSAKLTSTDKTLRYSNENKESEGINRLMVPEGTDYKIVLADGSKVWLNATTELHFPLNFTSAKREITLNGEAYLEIAKYPSKPFIVHLPGSTVEVTGTEFNINSYDSGIVKVSLVEGSVKMNAVSKLVKLSPGQEGFLNNTSLSSRSFNVRETLSWMDGLFYFQNADLKHIGRAIYRLYGVPVVLDNENLSSKKFTGVIDKTRSIKDFMNDIRSMSGVSSYLDSEGKLHFN